MLDAVCPLCYSRNYERRFSEKGYDLLVCQECELLYINPYPTDIDTRRTMVAEHSFEEIEILDANKHYLAEKQYYQSYWPFFEHECCDAKSILDVGCGTGHLLEKLIKFPDLVRVGIELNSDRASLARKNSKCEIHQVPIEVFSCSRKFDVITIMNVLSHIPSFSELLTSVKSLMSEKGKLILKVGEFSKDVEKGDVFGWGIPDHMHFLGTKTINVICEKYDFDIIRHDRIPLSDEIFTRERFETRGRSRVRNAIKMIIARMPFALSQMKAFYDLRHKDKVFSSLFVLTSK